MNEMRERVKEIRWKLKLSQAAFAQKMGIKQNSWGNIETGVNPFSDRYINLVCLTYNVRKEWLLYGRGEMFESRPEPPPKSVYDNKGESFSSEVAELIAIYQELVPLNQKAVLDYIAKTLQSQRNTIKAIKGIMQDEEDAT